MLKKTLSAAGIAGLLVLGAASAAQADDYATDVETVAGDVTLTPGQATVITAQNVDGTVTFATSGAGVSENTLTSIAFAAAVGSDTAVKQADENRTAQATFTAPTAGGTYTINITDGDGDTDSVTLTVAAAGSGTGGTGGTGGTLPATGSDAVPAAAIWLGAGAVGLGGIAVTAAVARRRAAANR
ncbi:hypothetical protein [Microbacterium sp. ABRD28]|uniref:hypothetical protein n=1 Tax=Microbacterium sp. ABRD28 TaxID=2268461 RepID=UPI000F555776|nr:hypothetical protein [Microbacterium sp. ABRD28]AZC12328.1 hypothetical protein DT073_00110 [Microbacterium sp. ABRD28]